MPRDFINTTLHSTKQGGRGRFFWEVKSLFYDLLQTNFPHCVLVLENFVWFTFTKSAAFGDKNNATPKTLKTIKERKFKLEAAKKKDFLSSKYQRKGLQQGIGNTVFRSTNPFKRREWEPASILAWFNLSCKACSYQNLLFASCADLLDPKKQI